MKQDRKPPPAPAWLARWTLDPPTLTARHDSGLVFLAGPDLQNFGAYFAMQIPAPAIIERLCAEHGGHNAPILLRKWRGEASKVLGAMLDETPPDLDNLRSEHERLKLWLATRPEKPE